MDYEYVRAYVFGVGAVDALTARPLTEAEIRWAHEALPVTIETTPGVVTVTMAGAGPVYRYFAQRPADWTDPAPDAPHQHARTAEETAAPFARAAVPPF